MANFICRTCGVQFAETAEPPDRCLICEDERQYVGHGGQTWMTLAQLEADYHNVIKPVEENLTGIQTHPSFAIGQRALLVQTSAGNLLWDCISLIDGPTMAAVEALGGVDAIAISHPHFYSSMVDWARAFEAPIYLHAANRAWVMRPDAAISFWEGDKKGLFGGLTLIQAGGHFPGSTALHWPAGAEGKGALLTGDTIQVVADRRYVSFMYSYPNLIPLAAAEVRAIVAAVDGYAFDRLYGGWPEKVVAEGAKEAVMRSAERYMKAVDGEYTWQR